MQLRRLRRDEMHEAAAVHRRAYDERLPWLAGRYTLAQTAAYFAERVFRETEIWGAIDRSRPVGVICFREGWIDQLYVLPSSQGAGIGGRLLHIARTGQSRIRLWTFKRNQGARAFYEKRDFVIVEETDGARNDEREPDVLYEWRAPG